MQIEQNKKKTNTVETALASCLSRGEKTRTSGLHVPNVAR